MEPCTDRGICGGANSDKVRPHHAQTPGACYSGRRTIEEDFSLRTPRAAELLQEHHQIHLIVWGGEVQTDFWNQIVAVDNVPHPAILPAGPQLQEAVILIHHGRFAVDSGVRQAR